MITSPADRPAPDFTLLDADARPVSLSAQLGRDVMLSFYPADFSPVCSSELSLFQECLEDIRRYQVTLLAISVDGPFCHRAFADHLRLEFPLLSDFWPHGMVARQYGVFREQEGIADRALFFIDAEGRIRSTWLAEHPGIAPGLNVVYDGLERLRSLRAARQGFDAR